MRLRLTLVYSGLFLAAGAVLLVVTYGLVAQSFGTGPPAATSAPASQYVAQALAACKAGTWLRRRWPSARTRPSSR